MGKAEDTKARLERAALTLFVARGVAETTTKEIAMAASVAEGTIYRYFPSKEQLALDLFLHHHRALAEALAEAQRPAKGLRAKIDAIVRCYCEWADRDWTLFAYHLLNQHSFLIQVPDGTANPVAVVREVISQAMKAGEVPRRNVDLAAASAIGVVLQAATYKVYGRFTGDLSDHVRFFADAAWAVLTVKEK
jgi:AcrR family transcriptional regulator